MKNTLVGYRRFTSKQGRECCVANVITEFSPADNGRGCYGSDVQSHYLPEHQVNLLTPSDIGKEVSLDFTISGGRAYLNDISIKK